MSLKDAGETGWDLGPLGAMLAPGQNCLQATKTHRNYQGLKITVCLRSWGKLWTIRYKKTKNPGLPWWLSKASACKCRGRGFHHPWSGKVPHASDQLSPVHHSYGAGSLEPTLRSKRSHCNEKPWHQWLKSSPRLSQLKKARVQQGRPSTANKYLSKI